MRLEKPLPDDVYHELRELQVDVDELWRDFEITHPDDIAPVITKIRDRIANLVFAADGAKQKSRP